MPTNPTDVVNPGFTVNALTPIVLTLDPARGENGQAGPPGQGLNWRDEWQTGVAYNAFDLVSRNGGSYIAEVNNTSVDPATDNGSVWGVMSAPGTPGPPGPAGMHWRGAWNASTTYAVNDGVSQLGQSYIAVSASTGIDPATDGGTHWQLMAASGSGGDMYKATYDVNNDGIVDHAALSDAVPYAGVTGKPASFPSDWSTTANKPATFPGDWNTTANKPSSFPASTHGASHVSTGGDAIPAASTSAGGLLKPLSGLATDYVGGDNACHSLASALPSGTVVDFAGATAPGGWLACDGSSFPTATYPNLFAAIGYTFGGSGANFNVPDLRGRTGIGAGQGSGLTNRTFAAVGGEEAHQLSIAELAAHTHVQNAHTHTYRYVGSDGTTGALFLTPNTGALTMNYTAAQPTSSVAAVNQNTGSGTAHNTMPPFLVLNKIIKT
jgi:microcystin-dependent protein